MNAMDWSTLIDSVYDDRSILPGHSLGEWLDLTEHDWDEVDRFLIDDETIGG